MPANDEGRGSFSLATGLCVIALVCVSGRALALPIGGRGSGQYQHVDQKGTVVYPDGTVRDTTFSREYWSQYYQLYHSASLGHDFSIYSQLDFNDESYTARPHASQSGSGTLRLAHPLFGVSATYRPTESRTAASSLGIPSDIGLFRSVKSRQDQTSLTANFMPRRLPRLDLSWVRQRQDVALGAPRKSTVSRNAGISYGTGTIDLRAGYGDQSSDPGGGSQRLLDRRNGNFDMGLRLDPTSALSLGVQYGLSALETPVTAGLKNRSLSHVGSLNGAYRASSTVGLNAMYSFQANRQWGGFASSQNSHEASLSMGYHPNPVASASVVGGVRTLHAGLVTSLERFVSASATAGGRIRTGWMGSASASHSTNWDPSARPHSVESVQLVSGVRAGRDLQLGAQVGSNRSSDPDIGQGRFATSASLSLSASPTRKFKLSASTQLTRSGPSLVHSTASSRSRGFDAHWLPIASVDLSGGMDQSKAGTSGGATSTSRHARVGLRPGGRLQLSGAYSRSDATSQIVGTSQLRGREVISGQLGLSLSRTLSLGADLNLVDPHGSNFSRQYDVTMTKEFGR